MKKNRQSRDLYHRAGLETWLIFARKHGAGFSLGKHGVYYHILVHVTSYCHFKHGTTMV